MRLCTKTPLSTCVCKSKEGGKRLSISADFEIQHPTSVIGISYFFKNLSQTPQPSQSLVIPELQLSEVLDGANHLRGVGVLVW